MVKPGRLVGGKVLGLGAAIVLVLGAAYVFRKTQTGTALISSVRGAGQTGGELLLAPIEGLISGVSAGVGSLTQEGAKIGANLASFGEAIKDGNFASIIDGSYVNKYGAPGDQSRELERDFKNPSIQDFTKTTIKDETPNGTSSIKQNFAATPVTIFNLEDILKRKTQSTAIQNLQSNLAANKARIATSKGTINIGSSTGVNFQTAAAALIARLRG